MISCAVTGSGNSTHRSPHVPVTPKEIAESVHAASLAGAAVAHIHVRDPETGKESWNIELFREVVGRIRDLNTDILINLTTGFGADIKVNPYGSIDTSGFIERQIDRIQHIIELKPDLCSLDCGTLNFGDAIFANPPNVLKDMATTFIDLGVKPEIEVFELGHVRLANHLFEQGFLGEKPLFQLCLGIPWGAPASTESMMALKNLLPKDALWSAFGIGPSQFPMVAQAAILDGNIRVGLEDNLYLEKGKLATNADLVDKAVNIIQLLGKDPMSTEQARSYLQLKNNHALASI